MRSRSRSCSRLDSAEDGADAKPAAMVPRMLMVLVLVLVLVSSGGGRGFAHKAELPGSSGEEVGRGVEKAVGTGEGVGSGGRRGKSGAELGWHVRNRSARRPDEVRRNMSLGRVEEYFRAGDSGWV